MTPSTSEHLTVPVSVMQEWCNSCTGLSAARQSRDDPALPSAGCHGCPQHHDDRRQDSCSQCCRYGESQREAGPEAGADAAVTIPAVPTTSLRHRSTNGVAASSGSKRRLNMSSEISNRSPSKLGEAELMTSPLRHQAVSMHRLDEETGINLDIDIASETVHVSVDNGLASRAPPPDNDHG